MVPCTEPYVDSTALQGAMVAISTASEHPVESFKFLNLLNTDPTLMTLSVTTVWRAFTTRWTRMVWWSGRP